MRLLITWIAVGSVMAFISCVGFRRTFGRMTLRLWGQTILTVWLWPITLVSATFQSLGYDYASFVAERFTVGWMHAAFDWWDRRKLRRLEDSARLMYIGASGQGTDLHGNPVCVDCCAEDVAVPPEIFVLRGGTLPEGRPSGSAYVRIRRGVASWESV
jgi:hypothetical protein